MVVIRLAKSTALGDRFRLVVGPNYVQNATPSELEKSFEKATGKKLKMVHLEDDKLRAMQTEVLREAQGLIQGT